MRWASAIILVTFVQKSGRHPQICILTETYFPVVGGGETQARGLVRGLINDHLEVFVGKREEEGRFSHIDTPCSFEVDTEANTITLRADIPGITEGAVVSFQTYDYLAEIRADMPG